MSETKIRIDRARDTVAEAATRVNELAAQLPEPVASVADAIASLTAEQRGQLWARRTEAMQLVAQQAAELREYLDQLTAHGNTLTNEAQVALERDDFGRLAEIAEWCRSHDDEIGQLKITIQELDELYALFEANPDLPSSASATAR